MSAGTHVKCKMKWASHRTASIWWLIVRSSSFILKMFLSSTLNWDLTSAPYQVPPHIPEYCPFRLQPKQFHVILNTLPKFPYPSPHATHFTPATSIFLQDDRQSSLLYAQYVQIISICHVLPHQPNTEFRFFMFFKF